MTKKYCLYNISDDKICGLLISNNDTCCNLHKHVEEDEVEEVVKKVEIKVDTKEDKKKDEEKDEEKVKKVPLLIRPNKYNNYLFPGTKFILDEYNYVVAKENYDGSFMNLTKSDIREIKTYKLRYKLNKEKVKEKVNFTSFEETHQYKNDNRDFTINYDDSLFIKKPISNPDKNIEVNPIYLLPMK